MSADKSTFTFLVTITIGSGSTRSAGTEFIVSGTAAKHTDLEGRGNQTKFEDDNYGGFLWVEIRDNCFYGEFYNEEGTMDFSHQFCK